MKIRRKSLTYETPGGKTQSSGEKGELKGSGAVKSPIVERSYRKRVFKRLSA